MTRGFQDAELHGEQCQLSSRIASASYQNREMTASIVTIGVNGFTGVP